MPGMNKGIKTIYKILKNSTTPKIKDRLYKIENNKIVGSCAFGEIGLQLHLPMVLNIFDIINELVKIGIPKHLIDPYNDGAILRKSIVNWNDNTSLTKQQIAQEIREQFGDIQ